MAEDELPAVLGLTEVARYTGVSKPNVRKMLARYGVHPIAQLSTGPIFRRRDVVRMQERRLGDERAREADRKRRETHRARAGA